MKCSCHLGLMLIASRPTADWLLLILAERVADKQDLKVIYVSGSSDQSGGRDKAEKLMQLRSPDLQPVALQSLDTSHELGAGASICAAGYLVATVTITDSHLTSNHP